MMKMEEIIKEIIEKINTTLFMVHWPKSHLIWDNIHLKACIGLLKEIEEDLKFKK